MNGELEPMAPLSVGSRAAHVDQLVDEWATRRALLDRVRAEQAERAAERSELNEELGQQIAQAEAAWRPRANGNAVRRRIRTLEAEVHRLRRRIDGVLASDLVHDHVGVRQ